jgi:SAM-dependent methyltransferase
MVQFISALKSICNDAYEWLVCASSSEQPFAIPGCAQRCFMNAFAFEYLQGIRTFVGGAERILIIGDGGGRDYYSLKLLGRRPVAMDVTRQSVIPNLVIADANRPLPFAAGTFDAVVMAEVVEHLPEDFGALQRIREILEEDGVLVLTVPYYNDSTPTHIRIHSPASVERLLQAAGWEVSGYVEKARGLSGVAGWTPLRLAFHFANLVSAILCGRTFYLPVNSRIARFDFWLGRRRKSVLRWFANYGAIIQCRKAQPVDWAAKNAADFENMHIRSRPEALPRAGEVVLR